MPEPVQEPSLARLERPPSLNESVQVAIRDYILTNQLKPGDTLPPETELGKQLGVSRNSIREAVKALQLVGLVEARRGSGLFVGSFSLEPLLSNLPFGLMNGLTELRELLEIRLLLEMGIVDRIIANRTEAQMEEMGQIIENMRVLAEQGQPFPKEDRKFHQCLLANCENSTLIKLSDVFWLTYDRACQVSPIEDYDPMLTYRNHLATFEAITNGDAEKTREAMIQDYMGQGSLTFRIDKVKEAQSQIKKTEDAE